MRRPTSHVFCPQPHLAFVSCLSRVAWIPEQETKTAIWRILRHDVGLVSAFCGLLAKKVFGITLGDYGLEIAGIPCGFPESFFESITELLASLPTSSELERQLLKLASWRPRLGRYESIGGGDGQSEEGTLGL